MNGVTLLGPRAKESSDSCDLGAFTESERVVRSWSGLKCGTARTVRYATIEERRAAACHADVQRCPELRFSRLRGIQSLLIIRSTHVPQETRNWVIQSCGGPPMGVLHMPTAAGHHPLKSWPRHEAPPHDNTEKRYIYTDY